MGLIIIMIFNIIIIKNNIYIYIYCISRIYNSGPKLRAHTSDPLPKP